VDVVRFESFCRADCGSVLLREEHRRLAEVCRVALYPSRCKVDGYLGIRYDRIVTDTPLYSLHPASLRTLFAEVETFARSQPAVFVGTAGSVLQRSNASSFAFYAHQYYDALGRKRERYVAGPVGSAEAEAAAEDLRIRIADLKNLVPSLRLLGREGFQLTDARTFATIASLHNHGLFTAGALLVGSHAYGALLNRLGVRAAAYRTEDIELARPARLAMAASEDVSLLAMLRSSGVEFVEVPQLDREEPATSFKEKGRSTFQVDLLAPGRGEEVGAMAIPEIQAHAQTLPYLGYLLEDSDQTAVIAREGCCAVRVPLPERFAVHKLIVSSMRRGRDAKILKDRTQASVLCAALAAFHPGALESAVRAVPRGARKHLRSSLVSVRELLQENHPRAWEELNDQPAR
jgi:hypothetical protein